MVALHLGLPHTRRRTKPGMVTARPTSYTPATFSPALDADSWSARVARTCRHVDRRLTS